MTIGLLVCGIHFHFTETEQKPFSKNTLRKCKVHINIHHKNKVGGPSNIVAGMPKKLKARVFWSPPNSSWSSYFLKEIWKGKKVASFSFNTWSSNSTECSYSSGLLWINDRIPQRTDPKGFFLSNGVYLQVHEKEKSSHGSCAGKGITATARRKVGSKAGVLWILQKKKKERNETLPLLPKASRKLHPSVFICIVCELPVYLLVTAASLLLWTRGNKMVIYRLLTVRLTGPERWISRNWENWQGSHCIIEKASAREGGWGRIIYIHFSRPPQERISSPGSGSVWRMLTRFHRGNFNQAHLVQRAAHSMGCHCERVGGWDNRA